MADALPQLPATAESPTDAELEARLAAAESEAGQIKPLTPRQQAFVQEYLVDQNGTQAAIRAGYALFSAFSTASTLLSYPNIKSAVERGMAQRASRVGVTAAGVLQEMALLANSDVDHYYIDDDGQVQLTASAPQGATRAIQSIKKRTKLHYDTDGNITGKTYDVELRLWDKPNPLKLMGKQVGLFAEKVEHSGPGGGPIPFTEVRTTIIDPKSEFAPKSE